MTDKDLKHNVESALDWDPSLDVSDIGVSVDEGVVTLRGNVASYAEKMTAERVALRVYAVKAVANDLAVHLGSLLERNDTEIAQAALGALKWNTMVPARSSHPDREQRMAGPERYARLAVPEGRRRTRRSRSHRREGCDEQHRRAASRQDHRCPGQD